MDDQESFKAGADSMDTVTKIVNHIIHNNPEINRSALLSGVMISAFNYVYALAPDQEAADEVINNSRQAAIEAFNQMPDVARARAGVSLPDDSSDELVFLDPEALVRALPDD
jgi:hypothetical protein